MVLIFKLADLSHRLIEGDNVSPLCERNILGSDVLVRCVILKHSCFQMRHYAPSDIYWLLFPYAILL